MTEIDAPNVPHHSGPSQTGGAGASFAPTEGLCQRCGGPNPCWSAQSPLWNAVMRGGSIDGPWEGAELICPSCFIALAEERGVASSFYVIGDQVNVPLETITPSGRVWDESRRLWTDPTPITGDQT